MKSQIATGRERSERRKDVMGSEKRHFWAELRRLLPYA